MCVGSGTDAPTARSTLRLPLGLPGYRGHGNVGEPLFHGAFFQRRRVLEAEFRAATLALGRRRGAGHGGEALGSEPGLRLASERRGVPPAPLGTTPGGECVPVTVEHLQGVGYMEPG